MTEEPIQQQEAQAIRALLIEDEASIVRMVRLLLAAEPDFEVIAVESGTEGLKRAVPGMMDVVLMDLHMPDIDDKALLTKLRDTLDVPIVVFSASTEREVEEDCIRGGAAAFIAKPFDPTTFASRLRAIVASWSEETLRP